MSKFDLRAWREALADEKRAEQAQRDAELQAAEDARAARQDLLQRTCWACGAVGENLTKPGDWYPRVNWEHRTGCLQGTAEAKMASVEAVHRETSQWAKGITAQVGSYNPRENLRLTPGSGGPSRVLDVDVARR